MEDEIALGGEVQARSYSSRLPFVVIVDEAISRRNRAAVALPNEVEQCGLVEALVLAAQTIEVPWGERGAVTRAPGDSELETEQEGPEDKSGDENDGS